MTTPALMSSPELTALTAAATAAGLIVASAAVWPEADEQVPTLAGFIVSDFSPLIAEVAVRVLRGRDPAPAPDQPPSPPAAGPVTAIVIVTSLGDVTSATRVAAAVDTGERVPPLLFYQSVPNSVAGYLAARWHLTGPVVCVTGTSAGLDVAALLIDDGDADEALVVRVDLMVTAGDRDRAAAILVTGPSSRDGT